MDELIVNADIKQVETLTNFTKDKIGLYCVPVELEFQISLVIDEIFTNIVSYGYPNSKGTAKLSLNIDEEAKVFKLIFTDNGIPFNPLAKEDPDVTLPPEKRKIGGLGIFMVKKLVDKVGYSRENDQNILTLEIVWPYKRKK